MTMLQCRVLKLYHDFQRHVYTQALKMIWMEFFSHDTEAWELDNRD